MGRPPVRAQTPPGRGGDEGRRETITSSNTPLAEGLANFRGIMDFQGAMAKREGDHGKREADRGKRKHS